MCCDTTTRPAYHGPAIRMIAMALFACILSVSVLSGFLILTHAGHEHDDNGPEGSCAACMDTASAERVLKQVSSGLAASGIAIASLFTFLSSVFVTAAGSVLFTLVQLKVRLNN